MSENVKKTVGGAGRARKGGGSGGRVKKTAAAAKRKAGGKKSVKFPKRTVRVKEKKPLENKDISLVEKENAQKMRDENTAIGICPFFQQDRGNGRVSCEGAQLKFPDKEARREFVYRLCAHPDGYKECPLRVALEHYYERKYAQNE